MSHSWNMEELYLKHPLFSRTHNTNAEDKSMNTSNSNTEEKTETKQNQQQQESLQRRNEKARTPQWNEDSYAVSAFFVLGYN